MEIKEIQNLIKFVAKSGAHEVKLETDDFKITIKTNADAPVAETNYITNCTRYGGAGITTNCSLPTEAEAPCKN